MIFACIIRKCSTSDKYCDTVTHDIYYEDIGGGGDEYRQCYGEDEKTGGDGQRWWHVVHHHWNR